MAHERKDFTGEKRVDRLLNRISTHRKRYSDSIKGEKVFVRPSVPRGGVVEFKVLWGDLDKDGGENMDNDAKNLKPVG